MREKVSNEPEMLRKQDILENVKDEPTSWISPIAEVPISITKIKVQIYST